MRDSDTEGRSQTAGFKKRRESQAVESSGKFNENHETESTSAETRRESKRPSLVGD